jgi:hypothetical protein
MNGNRPFRIAASGAVLSLISGAMVISGSVGASTAHGIKGGAEQVFAFSKPAPKADTVIFVGAFNDHGMVSGNTVLKFVLTKGAFKMKAISTTSSQLISGTCAVNYGGPVTYTIVKGSGTGVYVGISGSLDTTVNGVIILPTLNSGKCVLHSAKALPEIAWIHGSGSVAFK